MTINKDVSLSNQIYKSRDKIRNQIIEYMRDYLELENVDLTKSSFLSFMINTISTLTSNLMFYQSSIYREFFLTKAQLNESVYNLSSFLGYSANSAKFSTVNVLFTIPLEFESNSVEFEIPNGFITKAGDIKFRTQYRTMVKVTDNSTAIVTIYEENRSYISPVGIDLVNNEFYFLLKMSQIEVNEQEFQIDGDIKKYQFINIDVPLTGKLSDVNVYVKSPDNSTTETYTEYSSLFLIGSEERGFVYRKTNEGIRLYFGNGLIGYQPKPGSTVTVETFETEGVDGNIIPGSIKTGDRIFVFDDGERQILNYTVINPEQSSGGVDEESIEEIRNNSIDNLTTMDRLVSSGDYDNFKIIIDEEIIKNSVPILKRSDLKVNEIQLYTTLYQNNVLVPTRNEYITTTDLYIPRGSIYKVNGENYVTMFDMIIEELNKYATYYYYINTLSKIPILDRTFSDVYNIIINSFTIERLNDNEINLEVSYQPVNDESCNNCSNLSSELQILEIQKTYDLSNNIVDQKFEATINFENLPTNNVTLIFNNYYSGNLISSYSSSTTFKRDLEDIMMSNVVIDSTAGEDYYIVYDVPLVKESFINLEDDKEKFERLIIQKLINLNLEEKRMLTDFLNLKFANTTGSITNMLNNKTNISDVISIVEELPISPTTGDRYILEEDNKIYVYQGSEWISTQPNINNLVYVYDLDYKVLFTGVKWVKPLYELPVQIQLEVFIESNIVGTESNLITEIRETLYNQFSDRFGPEMELYKSEIINVIQNIEGVKYCHVLKPESDIFFEYNISDFEQEELLQYTPELVYFTTNSISIKIFRG